MKIGDEIYVRGIVDEIRGDTVIIKNEGGYFGTSRTEVMLRDEMWDETVFDADEFCFLFDKGRMHVFRRGRNQIIVKRPMHDLDEETIVDYGFF